MLHLFALLTPTEFNRLQELIQAESKTTQGPWTAALDEPEDVVIYGGKGQWLHNIEHRVCQVTPPGETQTILFDGKAENAEFIAKVRNEFPWLIELLHQVSERAWKNGNQAAKDHAREMYNECVSDIRNSLIRALFVACERHTIHDDAEKDIVDSVLKIIDETGDHYKE